MKIPTELLGNFCVRVMDLPPKAKGCVVMDEDGFYNIYLDSRLTRENADETLAHEIRHILRDDIHSSRSIRDIERREE